jgi:hypothetical protein
MNTVGKILVILNFLFAVVVGAFLVVDFATRTVWSTEYKKLQDNMTILAADRQAHADQMNYYPSRVKELDAQIEALKVDLADQEAKAKVEMADRDNKLDVEKTKLAAAIATLQKAISDVERLKLSETDLKKTVQDREKAILSIQNDVNKYRTDAIANEQLAKQLADRNQELLTQLVALQSKLNDAVGKASATGGSEPNVPQTGNAPNPPAALVKAKIDKVQADDPALVRLSAGTDSGVNKGNTMEVFRTSPAAKYLGMLRIVEAGPTYSVGRLIVPFGSKAPQLLVGDQVWSHLK